MDTFSCSNIIKHYANDLRMALIVIQATHYKKSLDFTQEKCIMNKPLIPIDLKVVIPIKLLHAVAI